MQTSTTAQAKLVQNLSNNPEALKMIKELAEIIKPLIDSTHDMQQISKDYYAEYMGILGRAAQGKPKGYLKLMAISMLYVGCNPNGVEEAVKLLSN